MYKKQTDSSRKILSLLIENKDIIFGLLWITSVFISFIEVYFYQGVILKHLSLDPRWVYGLTLLVGIAIKFSSIKTKSKIVPRLSKINFAGLIVVALALITLNIVEEIQYPNYVFTTLHLHPKGLIIPFIILLVTQLVLLPLDRAEKAIWFLFRPKQLVFALIAFIILSNFVKLYNLEIKDLLYIFKRPLANYDEKMSEKLGDNFYKFTNFVIDNSPEQSIILIPPQGFPWPRTGNLAYFRYFLYPRTLINGKEYEPGIDLKRENIDYVLLDWGETPTTEYGFTHGWPKFDIVSEKIILYNKDVDVEVIEAEYKYEDYKDLPAWGLIKIKQ